MTQFMVDSLIHTVSKLAVFHDCGTFGCVYAVGLVHVTKQKHIDFPHILYRLEDN